MGRPLGFFQQHLAYKSRHPGADSLLCGSASTYLPPDGPSSDLTAQLGPYAATPRATPTRSGRSAYYPITPSWPAKHIELFGGLVTRLNLETCVWGSPGSANGAAVPEFGKAARTGLQSSIIKPSQPRRESAVRSGSAVLYVGRYSFSSSR